MKKGNYEHSEILLNYIINSIGADIDVPMILSSKPGHIKFKEPEALKLDRAKDNAHLNCTIKKMKENIA